MRVKEAKRLLKTTSPTLESGWTNQQPAGAAAQGM
jgi:hypothetical protein